MNLFERGKRDGASLRAAAPFASPTGKLVIVLPVAPGTPPERLGDTVGSVRAYMPEVPVLLVSNSADPPPGNALSGPGAVITRDAPVSTYGPLAVSLGAGFRVALDRFDPTAILRLDVDALVTGPGLEAAILGKFAQEGEHCGMLGAVRFPSGGGTRNVERPAAQLRREAAAGGDLGRLLTELRTRALAHGYEDAEHANGCVSVIAAKALADADDAGILGHPAMEKSLLGEDILLALAVRSLGYRLAEFAGEGDPLGVKWRGLAFAPPTLLRQGRLAVHSVRHYHDWSEADIRAYFAGVRAADARLTTSALSP